MAGEAQAVGQPRQERVTPLPFEGKGKDMLWYVKGIGRLAARYTYSTTLITMLATQVAKLCCHQHKRE